MVFSRCSVDAEIVFFFSGQARGCFGAIEGSLCSEKVCVRMAGTLATGMLHANTSALWLPVKRPVGCGEQQVGGGLPPGTSLETLLSKRHSQQHAVGHFQRGSKTGRNWSVVNVKEFVSTQEAVTRRLWLSDSFLDELQRSPGFLVKSTVGGLHLGCEAVQCRTLETR